MNSREPTLFPPGHPEKLARRNFVFAGVVVVGDLTKTKIDIACHPISIINDGRINRAFKNPFGIVSDICYALQRASLQRQPILQVLPIIRRLDLN